MIQASFAVALGRPPHEYYSVGTYRWLLGQLRYVWQKRNKLVDAMLEEGEDEGEAAGEGAQGERLTRSGIYEQIREELVYLAEMCRNKDGAFACFRATEPWETLPREELPVEPGAREAAVVAKLQEAFYWLYQDGEGMYELYKESSYKEI